MEKSKTNIYIDGANLHRAAMELNFEIDYKKFHGWLRQKYDPNKIYLFMGLIPSNVKLYNYLQESGFSIIKEKAHNEVGTSPGSLSWL
jgi:hypothetical protein